MDKIYYDKDANLGCLKGKKVGIIGYGIQGRAQALNMRDSGVFVMVGNREDAYASRARRDGFKIHRIDEVARISDIVLFLIPDQVQPSVYGRMIKKNLRPGSMLVFAHGYALRYGSVKADTGIDVALLAPRMPGRHIRSYFLRGGGVPVFVDVVQDATGMAWKRLLALAKAAGFTRAGALKVDYRVETDLDLFTEQFLVAGMVKLIHSGFKVLTERYGYPAVPSLLELYASGELAEVLKIAAKRGVAATFQENASPTCQFGIADNFGRVLGKGLEKSAARVIKEIRDGSFSMRLDMEGRSGYRAVRRLWKTVNSPVARQAHGWIGRSFRTVEGRH